MSLKSKSYTVSTFVCDVCKKEVESRGLPYDWTPYPKIGHICPKCLDDMNRTRNYYNTIHSSDREIIQARTDEDKCPVKRPIRQIKFFTAEYCTIIEERANKWFNENPDITVLEVTHSLDKDGWYVLRVQYEINEERKEE